MHATRTANAPVPSTKPVVLSPLNRGVASWATSVRRTDTFGGILPRVAAAGRPTTVPHHNWIVKHDRGAIRSGDPHPGRSGVLDSGPRCRAKLMPAEAARKKGDQEE